MIKSKSELEKYLSGEFLKIAVSNDKVKQISTYAFETYEMPKGLVSDYVCLRKALEQANEFVLFILLDSLEKTRKEKKSVIDKYYTITEFKTYKNAKYNVDKIKFPLVFKMVQIDDSQWVGKIDVKMLMKLRAAELINYNTATQRVMERIIQGDKEIYKISLNHKAVKEIRQSFEDGSFISNTITFNIPIESECDFYYDDESCSLVIKSLEAFDIIDGWHRYIAMCQISDLNNEFNYQIELRLTHWDETKARTFIWQDNKKTFMKKVDSESYNLNNESNIIVERLNRNILCNMKGLIGRNQGLINFGEMAMLVNWFYIKNNKKKGSSNAIQLEAVKELTDNINILTESNTKYLNEKWNYLFLLSVMCVFNYCNNNEFDKRKMCNLIEDVYKDLSSSNNKNLKNHIPRKVLIDYVDKVIKQNAK